MGQEKDASKKQPEKKDTTASGSGSGGGVTVVMKVDLHCEGCTQKVKRSLKKFDGVESVKADFATNKLTVVGKVDPEKVKEKVEIKTKKKVDLVSPQPPSKKDKDDGNCGSKKTDEKPEKKLPPADDNIKKEQKKPKEVAVTTVVLKTKVHCDGCARKINKIINKCEGVEEVNVDLAKDQVTVKGTMNMTEILPYLNTKLKRMVEIVPSSKKDDKKPKDDGPGGGDKKGKEVAKPGSSGGDKKNKKNGEAKSTSAGGGEGGSKALEQNARNIEVVNRMEHFGYPNGYGGYAYDPQQARGNGYVVEYWNGPDNGHVPEYMDAPPLYLHAPQMFSDENPNACSIM